MNKIKKLTKSFQSKRVDCNRLERDYNTFEEYWMI